MPEHTGFKEGQRVQVFNPGPLAKGVVLKDAPSYQRHVHVGWDDGETGWPQGRLLRVVREDKR